MVTRFIFEQCVGLGACAGEWAPFRRGLVMINHNYLPEDRFEQNSYIAMLEIIDKHNFYMTNKLACHRDELYTVYFLRSVYA